jgi:mannosyltransferase
MPRSEAPENQLPARQIRAGQIRTSQVPAHQVPANQTRVIPANFPPGARDEQASRSVSDSVRSARWLILIICFAAGAALRLAHLGEKPFWFDECFSVELARLDWRNFLHLLWWREANMSLYYLLLRAWLGIAPFPRQSQLYIRSLSAVFAVATLPALYWLARLLYNRRVALIAAVLFTANAYSVRYAQEARSYALFLLLATLSSAFLVAWLRKPLQRNLLAYILISILAVYAHFYALLLIAVHWLVLRRTNPEHFIRLGAETKADLAGTNAQLGTQFYPTQLRRAWKIIALAVLPLLIFVAKTGTGPIRWIPRPGITDLLAFLENLAGSNHWPLVAIYALACLAAVVGAGVNFWTRDSGWEGWRTRFLLSWLLFPLAFTVLLSQVHPVFLGRYMIFCLPPLLILAAAGLARLRQPWMLAVVLTAALFLSLQGVAFVYGHDFDTERDASGAASDFILDHAQPGDAVIFHIAGGRVPYEFFRSLRAGENTASPSFTRPLGPGILFPHNGPGLNDRDFTGKPTPDFLRNVASSHARLWVLLIDNGPPGSPDATTVMMTETLPQLFPNLQRWQFSRVELRLYGK